MNTRMAGWGILPKAARNPSRPTVVVVDDEALIRWALSEGLSAAGYPVEVAGSGAAAKAALASHEAEPCVVVLDLRLPDVADLSLLVEIRSRWPGVPVVVMTAHGGVTDEAEALRLGAFRFLSKPFDVSEIVHAVDAAWQDQQFRH